MKEVLLLKCGEIVLKGLNRKNWKRACACSDDKEERIIPL